MRILPLWRIPVRVRWRTSTTLTRSSTRALAALRIVSRRFALARRRLVLLRRLAVLPAPRVSRSVRAVRIVRRSVRTASSRTLRQPPRRLRSPSVLSVRTCALRMSARLRVRPAAVLVVPLMRSVPRRLLSRAWQLSRMWHLSRHPQRVIKLRSLRRLSLARS